MAITQMTIIDMAFIVQPNASSTIQNFTPFTEPYANFCGHIFYTLDLTSSTAYSGNIASGSATVSLITFDEPNTTFTIAPDNLRTIAGNELTYNHDLLGDYVFTLTASLIDLTTYAVGLDS